MTQVSVSLSLAAFQDRRILSFQCESGGRLVFKKELNFSLYEFISVSSHDDSDLTSSLVIAASFIFFPF